MISRDLLRSLVLRSEWGAEYPSARALIRAEISKQVGKDVSDLASLPDTEEFSVSISHCNGHGGFIAVRKPASVGLDVELFARVPEKSVARMSTPDEMREAPTPAHLWAAKEAVFKALRGTDQPQAISSITIANWQPGASEKLEGKITQFYDFQARRENTLITGNGIAFINGEVVISIFCLPSST